MVGIILPADKPMTRDQMVGFRMACACFATWGRQIEHEGIKLGGPAPDVAVAHNPMEHAGRMVRYVAEALDRTIGTGRHQPGQFTE